MDADGAFRAKRLEHVHRFFRADMVAAHQLARAEGTDCDQRQPWPPPLGGFSHPASIAPAGVAGEEQIAARKRDSESGPERPVAVAHRSEEHTSELQSLMRISYAVFCLKKKKNNRNNTT